MQDHKTTIDIAIIDDHPVVIEGLKNLLMAEPAFYVKAHFTTGTDFINYLENNTIDVALLDITLPDGNGIRICREVCRKYPQVKVLAISNLSERSIIKQMQQSGAAGYLLKTATASDIRRCILLALDGAPAMSEEVNEIMASAEAGEGMEIPDLTKREKQILGLLAEGKKTTEIAAMLFISPLTVKTHRATMLQKFGANNMVQLINKAREHGLM